MASLNKTGSKTLTYHFTDDISSTDTELKLIRVLRDAADWLKVTEDINRSLVSISATLGDDVYGPEITITVLDNR